jgi:uncharacterized protein Veg
MPLLTVEDIIKNRIYICLKQPHSETVYIPYVPKWVLTSEMIKSVLESGIIKQVYWECPYCREWKPLLSYYKNEPRLITYEIRFGAGSICFSTCYKDVSDLRQRHIEIAFEDGKRAPNISITEMYHRLDKSESSGALNNTYPSCDLISRHNSNGHEHKVSFSISDLFNEDYITKQKEKIKRELARVGAKPLREVNFHMEMGTITAKSKDDTPLDLDDVIESAMDMIG